ncbi:MAG: LysE family translocator [Gammaproteobacteria bacterium]|nr:LysE family translocator [Gammaproteobacteria bacterium]
MELILSIAAFAFTATITPGPNNIMIMASGVNFGMLRSLPHLMGICFGFAIMVVLIGMGFGMVFHKLPILYEIIKIVGILYLLYLAWRIAKAGSQSGEQTRRKPFTFIQSALFQWLNPKAWIMGSSAIAAYTRVDEDIFLQVLLIAFIFLLVAFPSTGSWLVFGRTIQRFLQKPVHQNVFNISMALLLVATVIPAVLELIT